MKASAKPRLLIVEDDPGLQRQMRWSFDDYDVAVAGDRDSAIAAVHEMRPPVVTLDLGLPPDVDGASEGLATLEAILSAAPDTKVIVVTGNEDRKNAVRAIGLGAYDFYSKPIDSEVLGLIIDRATRLRELEDENRRLALDDRASPLKGMITSDTGTLNVCRMVEKIAPADVSVLLRGESGTGKELLARALHELSPRADKRLVVINCAAIPETLLESELFGHEKGAFTGAVKQTIGKIEMADGGTLFLDEIGDVPVTLQVKLLRFLQERTIERIGGRREIAVDARIVCATHQNLDEMIAGGSFREDLYYRISEVVIRIPALRERANDPILLARNFIIRFRHELGRPVRDFTAGALDAIAGYAWPGNVRELENRVKRAVIMAEGSRITVEDLELESLDAENATPLTLKATRERAEQDAVARALARADGNISQAAKLLGVSRPTLYDLMKHHGAKT